jgi:hypothetical protein
VSYDGSDAYKNLGLYGIMKLSRFKRDYDQAVQELAGQIVAAAKRFPVKEGPAVDFDALGNAFNMADSTQPGERRSRTS